MKYLKRFNEELDPSTYMSAGKGLLSKGHTLRGQKLIDHSMSKTQNSDNFDFYFGGKKMTCKWDYKDNCFITDAIPERFYVMKGSESIGVVCACYPRMGEKLGQMSMLKQGRKLLNFLSL